MPIINVGYPSLEWVEARKRNVTEQLTALEAEKTDLIAAIDRLYLEKRTLIKLSNFIKGQKL
jgi:phenylpyruvate tautomerase PptA (4-oxalocrotonate tautomerase family)